MSKSADSIMSIHASESRLDRCQIADVGFVCHFLRSCLNTSRFIHS